MNTFLATGPGFPGKRGFVFVWGRARSMMFVRHNGFPRHPPSLFQADIWLYGFVVWVAVALLDERCWAVVVRFNGSPLPAAIAFKGLTSTS